MHADAQIAVTYHETEYDRVVKEDDGTTYVYGLPFRAERDGAKAAATTSEGARDMVAAMLARRDSKDDGQ